MALEIGDDADQREWAMTMMLAARAIERIADNAVDIGEQVAFVVTGLFREFEDASHPGREGVSACGKVRPVGADPATFGTQEHRLMLCAAIDIGSNTTRVLVAEPVEGQLKKVMEQRAYTRINKAIDATGRSRPTRSTRSARSSRPRCGWRRSSARRRSGPSLRPPSARRRTPTRRRRDRRGRRGPGRDPQRGGGGPALLHRRHQDAGPPGPGQDRGRRRRRRLDRGDPRHRRGGVEPVRSWQVGSGALADELIVSDPPSAAEIRKVRDRIDDIFAGVEIEHPDQAVAVGGRATSLREAGRGGARVRDARARRAGALRRSATEVARRFELDPVRVRILPTGVLILEKVSELLGQPLQIGKGGLREGIILDLFNGSANGSSPERLAA